MKHVEVLRHMKETIRAIMPSEVAALDAAIAALSAQQPPAEAQPVGEVKLHGGLLYGQLDRDLPQGTKLYAHPPPSAPVGVRYDAGLLSDYGGGNVGWWHDYIRSELDRAHDFYTEALAQQPAAAGEDIMVNAAHDVYTLPLQPSGLSSGPRFVVHVPAPEQPAAHPAITHCDNFGCDWLDNGLNPIGCPYCKQNAWRAAYVAERATRYREVGMKIEQARIHAETDAVRIAALAAQPGGSDNDR